MKLKVGLLVAVASVFAFPASAVALDDMVPPTAIAPANGASVGVPESMEFTVSTSAPPTTTVFFAWSAYPYIEETGDGFAGQHTQFRAGDYGATAATRVAKFSYYQGNPVFLSTTGTIYWRAYFDEECSQPYFHTCYPSTPVESFTYNLNPPAAPTSPYPECESALQTAKNLRGRANAAKAKMRRLRGLPRMEHLWQKVYRHRVQVYARSVRHAEKVCPTS